MAKINNLKILCRDFFSGIGSIYEVFIANDYGKFDFRNKIVMDIGGYIGDTALYFVSKGAKKVYVFEINQEVFNTLKKNIKSNHLEERIIPYNIGVSDKHKNKILYISNRPARTGTYKSLYDPREINEERNIQLKPFKDVLKEPIDVLKIDCEGCEYDILENILNNNLVDKIREGIVLESHNIDDKRNSNYIISLLRAMKFTRIFYEKRGHIISIIYAKK